MAERVIVTMVQLQLNYQRAEVHIANTIGVTVKNAKGYIVVCCHIHVSQGISDSYFMWLWCRIRRTDRITRMAEYVLTG